MEKIILIFAIIIMMTGVYIDTKEKKFPNILFIILILLGIFYSTHLFKDIKSLGPSLSLFLVFNICGIFFHKYKIIAPGDMKFFSIFPFYINWNGTTSVCFLICVTTTAFLFSFIKIYIREKDIKKVLLNFKYQFIELKIFMLSKIRVSPNYSEIDKNEGFAFTLQLFIAFMITLICQKTGLL